MSNAVLEQRPRRSLSYHLGTVALWTGFLGFSTFIVAILIPAC